MPSNEKVIRILLRLEDQASKELEKSANAIGKLKANLTSLGTQMTAAFTVPIVAAGVAGVNMAKDLDAAMKNVQSISKQTDAEIAALSDTFIEMSTDIEKTTDTAQNLAEAFYTIQGSGFAGADAMTVLEASTKAATAGLTSTEIAAKGTTAILNAYGLSAAHASDVSDILFRTVDRGVGSYEELVGAISNVTGTAAAVGVEFEEIAAAMATMSKQGFSFSEASVSINQALTAFLSPSEAMAKAINELGYASGSAMIDALGFAGSMQALAEHTGGSEEAMAALFGNVRSMRAAFALTGAGAQMFSEDLLAMANATGATAEAFAIQTQSFEAQWKNFQNVANAALIELGQTLLPILSSFLQNVVIPLIQGFRALPEPVKGFIIALLGVLAVIGPILLIAGQLIGAFTALAALGPIIAAGFAFVVALGAPLLILIGLIIAAIVLLIANWNQLGTTLTQIGTIIDQAMGGVFSKARDSLVMLTTAIWESAKSFANGFYEMGVAIINGLINGIKSKAVDLIAYVFGLSKEMTAAIKSALGISSPSKVMMKLGNQVTEGFQKGISQLGGVGVDVTTNGRRGTPSLATAGTSAGGGYGGGGNVFNIYPPMGTTEEQILYITKEVSKNIGNDAKRMGAKKRK